LREVDDVTQRPRSESKWICTLLYPSADLYPLIWHRSEDSKPLSLHCFSASGWPGMRQ